LFATPVKPFSVSLSLFYNLLSDRITYVTGDDGIGQYQNFGEVLYTGADVALSCKLHTTFKAKGSYTYLEVKDQETDLWLPGKAQHVANITLYWQPYQPFSLVATGKYSSEVYRNKSNTKTAPEYTIADLRAEYGFKRFSLFGEIKNLFDETYYYADGLLAPTRTWVVGVNWRI
jgi:iron complex outermembrane receptor protein